ncbi:hypothetical protein TNCV_3232551 [Trichonephila clavipes]|nr:hypothetical protein TNCV_3232551 [Trichonephila clavipes]
MGGQVGKSITPETQCNPFNHGSVMSLFRVKFPEVFPLICALSREEPPKGSIFAPRRRYLWSDVTCFELAFCPLSWKLKRRMHLGRFRKRACQIQTIYWTGGKRIAL